MRFWGSSAVVPLVVGQPVSADVERWIGEDAEAVTWTLTPVEVASALPRLVRDGVLPERSAIDAEFLLGELLGHTHVVSYVERVKPLACRLLRVHTLRAGDALQLAAALPWSGRTARRMGSSFTASTGASRWQRSARAFA